MRLMASSFQTTRDFVFAKTTIPTAISQEGRTETETPPPTFFDEVSVTVVVFTYTESFPHWAYPVLPGGRRKIW